MEYFLVTLWFYYVLFDFWKRIQDHFETSADALHDVAPLLRRAAKQRHLAVDDLRARDSQWQWTSVAHSALGLGLEYMPPQTEPPFSATPM